MTRGRRYCMPDFASLCEMGTPGVTGRIIINNNSFDLKSAFQKPKALTRKTYTSQGPKAFVKRCLFRSDLKESSVGNWRIASGREFQRVGAATLKAVSEVPPIASRNSEELQIWRSQVPRRGVVLKESMQTPHRKALLPTLLKVWAPMT